MAKNPTTPAVPAAAVTGYDSYALQAGIEVPPSLRGAGFKAAALEFPLDKMEPGHSFFLPTIKDPEAEKKMVAKLRNAAVSYGKRYKRNYFVRFLDGHGWGCWRTADDTPEEAAAKTAKSLERKNKAAAKAAAEGNTTAAGPVTDATPAAAAPVPAPVPPVPVPQAAPGGVPAPAGAPAGAPVPPVPAA